MTGGHYLTSELARVLNCDLYMYLLLKELRGCKSVPEAMLTNSGDLCNSVIVELVQHARSVELFGSLGVVGFYTSGIIINRKTSSSTGSFI